MLKIESESEAPDFSKGKQMSLEPKVNLKHIALT